MSLYRKGILRLLKTGTSEEERVKFFNRVITEEARDTARRFGAEIARFSNLRIAQAQDYWQRDVMRLRETIRPSRPDVLPEPDEFKQAAFLAYWLRRRIVVDGVQTKNLDLARYMNEIVAFVIGFRICHLHQAIRPEISGEEALERIRQFQLTKKYVREVAVFLHHKNVSPHALYLVYKSLFQSAIPPASRDFELVRS